jgi:hypothetical protein
MHNLVDHINNAVFVLQWRLATGTFGAAMLAISVAGLVALVRSIARDLRSMAQPAE